MRLYDRATTTDPGKPNTNWDTWDHRGGTIYGQL